MKSDLFYALAQVILKNCLTYRYSNNADTWQFNAINQDSQNHKIKVKGNYRVNNSASLKQALIAGMGVARLPTFVTGDSIKKGELVALFQGYTMPHKSLYAVYPERHYLPTKVRAFLDFLIEHLGTDVPFWDNF